MATGKRFYWIKLKESFLSSDTVDYLMEQPNGANYVVLYQMLCLKTINTNGRLSRQIGEVVIPYDAEKIARDCKWFSVDTVRVAMNLYKSFGLIYEDENGVLVMADHENLVGSETDYAEKNRRMRSDLRAALLTSGHNVSSDVSGDVSGDVSDFVSTEKDIRYKILDKEEEVKEEESPPCPFEKIKALYNDICQSYPQIVSIDGKRRTAVLARWRSYKDINSFEKVFRNAESSDFMKGKNARNWKADFDWMMCPTNFAKVLENKYGGSEKKQSDEMKELARRKPRL